MKSGIHPDYIQTKVTCNGCNTTFETRSTVPEITVEICSNCHPFYTGKQKLVDTAGRVDKFRARQEAAKAKQATKPAKAESKQDEAIEKIEAELEEQTVELPAAEETKEPKTEA